MFIIQAAGYELMIIGIARLNITKGDKLEILYKEFGKYL
jgi:hypothetical protein